MEYYSADWKLLLAIAIAAIAGGLIGFERERHSQNKTIYAGIRTIPLVAIIGTVIAYISNARDTHNFVIIAFIVIGIITLFMAYLQSKEEARGLTSPLAFLAAFLLGVMSGYGFLFETMALGIALTFLLSVKETLHNFATLVNRKELENALYFLALAAVLYPITPSTPIHEKLPVIIPQDMLLLVLMISGISFIGFIALRVFGAKRGLPISGFFGGLVNSEATTISLINISRENPAIPLANIKQSIYWAMMTMLARGMIILALADPTLTLVKLMLPVIIVMVGTIGMFLYMTSARQPSEEEHNTIDMGSPFAIMPALRFTMIFAVITILAYAMQQIDSLGVYGVYLLSLGGLVSAGSVLAAVGVLVGSGEVNPTVGAWTATLTLIFSMINKPALAFTMKHKLRFNLSKVAAAVSIITLIVASFMF